MRSLERFVYTDDYSSGDLLWIMRNYQSFWSKVMDSPVTLCFKEGQIDFEIPPLSPSYSKMSLRSAMAVKRTAEGEKALYILAINKLDAILKQLSTKELEALYWRLIDRSCTKVNNVHKPPSSRELSSMLDVPYSTFRDRLVSGWEKLGFSWEDLRDYLQFELIHNN